MEELEQLSGLLSSIGVQLLGISTDGLPLGHLVLSVRIPVTRPVASRAEVRAQLDRLGRR